MVSPAFGQAWIMRFFFSALLVLCFLTVAFALERTSLAQEGGTQMENLAAFGEVEERIIRGFFDALGLGERPDKGEKKEKDRGEGQGAKDKDKDKEMPPGLAKMEELPPGLQRHLERYGALPPGLEKRSLPSDLEARLPALDPGLERILVDDDVLLIERVTGLILDVLENVLTSP